MIYYPDSARYDTCGAPVVIIIAGGKGSQGIVPAYPAYLTNYGFIEVFFNFPGGGSGVLQSGGAYDLRGPACITALKDVIKFCCGQIENNAHKFLNEIIPVTPNYNDVGLVGGSNGGNIALAVTGMYGDSLPGLKWIVNWESPVGDGNILADMGVVNMGGGNPTCNKAYNDTTGNFDYTKLRYTDTLYFGYGQGLDTVAGFYFDNNNDDIPGDTLDFSLEPLIYGSGLDKRAYYSKKIIELGYSMGLIPAIHPYYIPSDSEATEFWKWRDGGNWIDTIGTKRPDLLFMVTAKNHNHYISAPDAPGVLFQYNAFLNTSLPVVRLNPDSTYLRYVLDTINAPGLSDNECFTVYDHLSIRNAMEPDSIDEIILYSAGACELADRSIRGDYRIQLDSVYDNCIPYVADTISDTTSDTTYVSKLIFRNEEATIFPNPSSASFTLSFESMLSENIFIEMSDVTGRKIFSEGKKSVAGKNNFTFSNQDFENGTYLIALRRNGGTQYLKLEVLH